MNARVCTMAALLVTAIAARPFVVYAQDFGFEVPAAPTDSSLPAALRDLAERVLPGYEEDDPDRYLANLAALQMTIEDPTAAHATRLKLRERRESEPATRPAGRAAVYDIYVHARAIEASDSVSFTAAYRQAFEEAMSRLDDVDAYELEPWFSTPAGAFEEDLQRLLDSRREASSVTLGEALELVQASFAFDAYRSFGAEVRPLLAQDSARRYAVEEVVIPVAPDATLAATLVRPRKALEAGEALPTLLEFTLDRAGSDAREAAAHGYASLLALARIAGNAKSRPRAPFESDGDDARAVIDWIVQQSWTDGRVAMQGNRYGGFVAWSAAKRRPAALQAIATSDPLAPGIDVPSPNRIFHNSAYRWVQNLLTAAGGAAAREDSRSPAADDDWYRTGRSYRELPPSSGRAASIFRSWLNHPSYDRFWQKWLPFGPEFDAIDIPVLTITGYYSAGETAALYYFTQHRQHDEAAEHALLIGPFDEHSVVSGAAASLRDLDIDVVARIDAADARYAWLAHVLRGAERPELVSAAVNYELSGANEWRHESSLTALESNPLRFYLEAMPTGAAHRLVAEQPAAPLALTTTVDLRDRDDFEWRPTRALVLDGLHAENGAIFATEPFGEDVDIAGRFGGVLDFTVNKYDVDFVMTLYELNAAGVYVKLFDPGYAFRASYARNRTQRRLLVNGVRQQVSFQSERMFGRRLAAGSRLVMALGVNKRADQQINYGAGGDVSEESLEDAGAPVRVRWHEGTFIEVPAQR
ncbi:MAG TPA: CocE/NonD family hydrolase [Gammaproteobacteria bacterium]|nr:CocE/NonD family hydrolase [Gammaproteobacteria bacterium]